MGAMSSLPDRIVVVLCHPEGGINVGSVCRAMKTMGLSRLTIVGDPGVLNRKSLSIMAVHSSEIFKNARICGDINEALEGTVLSAGVTRRRGSKRKFFSLLPEEFAARAAETGEGDVAVVFGNEQHGLTGEEIAACSTAVHIPSNPDFPSLNLSHAVQVIAAALFREHLGDRTGRYTPIDRAGVEDLTATVHEALDAVGYFDKADRFFTDRFFRDILTRAALSPREAAHLTKVFRKIRYLKAEGD